MIRAIKNELASFYSYTSSGSLRAFGHTFAGTIELLQEGQNLDHVAELMDDFVKAVESHVIDQVDFEVAEHLVETLDTIVTEVIKKQDQGIEVLMIK